MLSVIVAQFNSIYDALVRLPLERAGAAPGTSWADAPLEFSVDGSDSPFSFVAVITPTMGSPTESEKGSELAAAVKTAIGMEQDRALNSVLP